METRFGLQVDVWGVIIPGRGDLANSILADLVLKFKQMEIPSLKILRGNLPLEYSHERREHTVFVLTQENGNSAAVAVRISDTLRDLDISWRLFEKNAVKSMAWGVGQALLAAIGLIVTIVGIGLIPIGVGVFFIPVGLGMIGFAFRQSNKSGSQSQVTTYNQYESRFLANKIAYTLFTILDDHGITQDELKVLEYEQNGGLQNIK